MKENKSEWTSEVSNENRLKKIIVQEHMSKIWVPWEFREESKQLD